MKDIFRKFSNRVSYVTGTAGTFLLAMMIIIVWALSGPAFNYSNTWQLVINTGTTIVTFLMVFLIQNTQNRDAKAMHLKLDELIRATEARDSFVDLEDLTDEELKSLDTEFRELHDAQASSRLMVKLHKTIEAEHARRQHLRKAKEVINSIIHGDKSLRPKG